MVKVLLGSFLAASESTALSTLVDDKLARHDAEAKIPGPMLNGFDESSPHLFEKGQGTRSLRALLLSRSLSNQTTGSPPEPPRPFISLSTFDIFYITALLWYSAVILTATLSMLFDNELSWIVFHVGGTLEYVWLLYHHVKQLVNTPSNWSVPVIHLFLCSANLYLVIMSGYIWLTGTLDKTYVHWFIYLQAVNVVVSLLNKESRVRLFMKEDLKEASRKLSKLW